MLPPGLISFGSAWVQLPGHVLVGHSRLPPSSTIDPPLVAQGAVTAAAVESVSVTIVLWTRMTGGVPLPHGLPDAPTQVKIEFAGAVPEPVLLLSAKVTLSIVAVPCVVPLLSTATPPRPLFATFDANVSFWNRALPPCTSAPAVLPVAAFRTIAERRTVVAAATE